MGQHQIQQNLHHRGLKRRRAREKGAESLFKETMAETSLT